MPDPTAPARWKGYARDLYIADSTFLGPETDPPAHISHRFYLDGDELPLSNLDWSITGGGNDCTIVSVEAWAKDVRVDWDHNTVWLAEHSLMVPQDAVPNVHGLADYDTVTLQFFIASVTIGGPLP